MFFLSIFNSLVQTFAALVIFVAGYLALLLCAIAGILIGHLIYRAARLIWIHVVVRYASTHAVTAKIAQTADAHFPPNDILLAPPALNRR